MGLFDSEEEKEEKKKSELGETAKRNWPKQG